MNKKLDTTNCFSGTDGSGFFSNPYSRLPSASAQKKGRMLPPVGVSRVFISIFGMFRSIFFDILVHLNYNSLIMNEEDKNNHAHEPTEKYEVTQHPEVDSEEFHPVLRQLIEQSIKEHDQGLSFSHEEAMKRIREKYPFLR